MRYFTPFLFLLLFVALLFRVEFFFTILYFLAAVYLLAQLWMRQGTKQLRGGRQFTDRAFTDDRVTVRLMIHNDGWLPLLWVEIDETLPLGLRAAAFERQVIALSSHDRWETTYTLTCYRRGRYQIGPTTIRTGDPLGIARQELRWREPNDLVVYPRIVPLERLGLPTRSPLAILPASTPLFEDSSRIVSVRDYQRGDSLRRVHWPATARTGHLVIKQYQPAIARETVICLDLHNDGYANRFPYDAVELAITVTASLANHAIVREGLPLGLLTQAASPKRPGAGDETPPQTIALAPRKERAHLITILEHLAEVEMLTEQAEPFTGLLRRDRLGLAWGGTVVIVTGRGSTTLTEAILSLRRGGLALAIVLVGVTRPTDGTGDWLAPPGVKVHCVNSVRDLEALG